MGRKHDNHLAAETGQATTGRVITAAASIMLLVFAVFVFNGRQVIGELGIGLAAAVLLGAFIVRTFVRALMPPVRASQLVVARLAGPRAPSPSHRTGRRIGRPAQRCHSARSLRTAQAGQPVAPHSRLGAIPNRHLVRRSRFVGALTARA